MSTSKIDKMALRPVSASTTRHGGRRSQHLPVSTRQPFLGFQLYLSPHPFHTVLGCTNIHYARLAQKLPHPRLCTFQSNEFSVPSYVEQCFDQKNHPVPGQPKLSTSQSILENVNWIRPMFLKGYSRARATRTPNDISGTTALISNTPILTTLSPSNTFIPVPTIHLPSTDLQFPSHAFLGDCTWALPIIHAGHTTAKDPEKDDKPWTKTLIQFTKKTVVRLNPFLVHTVCCLLCPLLLCMGTFHMQKLQTGMMGH